MRLALPGWGIFWLLGVALQLQQAQVWPLLISLGVAACSVVWLVLALRWAYRVSQSAFAWVPNLCLHMAIGSAIVLLSWATLNVRCWVQMQDALDPLLEGQDLQLVVDVASLPHALPQGLRFHAKVVHAFELSTHKVVKVPPLIDLSWLDWESPHSMDLPLWRSLQPGDRWQFQVRLKRPHGSMNPGGFDAELRWWELGIMATGTVRSGKTQAPPFKLNSSWQYPVDQMRQHVRTRIQLALRTIDPQAAGVISALVVGDQASIETQNWEVFRATGVAHLMSISGLHITMFAWLASTLIYRLWCASARAGRALCLRVPATFAASLGGLMLAAVYALFCGWGLPAQRTILMLLVVSVLRWRGLRWPWHRTWGLVLWVVTLWDPWALLQASFWLSFAAVGALMLSDQREHIGRTKLVDEGAKMVQKESRLAYCIAMITGLVQAAHSLAREQWLVTVTLAPLTILFFGQLSVSGLLANLLAIPWVTLCVTPLAMMGLVWSPMWQLAAWALQPLFKFLTYLSSWSWGLLSFAQAPWVLTLLALLGALVCFQQWSWAIRCWGALCMLPVLLWQSPRPDWGQFELWALDIGQGNAVLLRTQNHALLYDAGPAWGESSDAGQRVLVPFMAREGVKLNRLMLSHRDADHTGGAASVLAAHPQADLWASLEPDHPLAQVRQVESCRAGQRWVWDGVQFEVLHPALADQASHTSTNAVSCVLRIDTGQGQTVQTGHDVPVASALLPGDIEALQELELLNKRMLQPVDFLLVPHHGSQTSSTLAFVQTLSPKWAMVQSGYRNRYGHPAQQVVLRYQQLGVPMAISPVCGAAHWQSTQPQQLDCERDKNRRYWHFKPPSAP